jgi:hypothetical protein
MPLHAGAQSRHVFGLGIIHFEKTADFKAEWNGVQRRFLVRCPELIDIRPHGIHGGSIVGIQSSLDQGRRHVIAMDRRKILLDLLASPMPVQIAPSADIHQNVEHKPIAATEFLDQFLIWASLAKSDFDQVLFLFFRPVLNCSQNVSVRRLTRSVQQGRG